MYINLEPICPLRLGFEPSKRRPFPFKTRVIWVPGIPSLKLTANVLENRPSQKETKYSNHQFSGAMLVYWRVHETGIHSMVPTTSPILRWCFLVVGLVSNSTWHPTMAVKQRATEPEDLFLTTGSLQLNAKDTP